MRSRIGILAVTAIAILAPGITRAQFPNVRISNEANFDPYVDPEEVSIAINPRNPNQLAAGANIRYLFTSSNGGLDWTADTMHSQYGFWGDPCLMFDDSGILYYEHLSGRNWQDTEFLWRIVVQRSMDAGKTFDVGEQIGLDPPTMQDKAWLSLDRSPTASNGALYTSWNEDDRYGSRKPSDSSRIFFAKTTDHGASWSGRVRVDDLGGDCLDSANTIEGATTAAGTHGEIYIAWEGRDSIFFDRSLDGGKTFGKDQVIQVQPGGWDFKVPGIFRANGFPMLATDLNPASQYYGRLYIMWSDQRRGVTDVYSMRSDNGGTAWSAPLRVNTDTALNHHFFPSMTLDPVTGHIFIVFYDRRAYLSNETDIYLATSIDGGASFTNTKISESAFLPADTIFFGDYIHVTAYDRHVFPIWMRLDFDQQSQHNRTSVWTAIVSDTAHSVPADRQASPELLRITQGAKPGIAFTLVTHGHVRIAIFDDIGREVATLIDGEYGAGEYRIGLPQSLTPGAYLVRMTTISATNEGSGSFDTHVAKLAITQ